MAEDCELCGYSFEHHDIIRDVDGEALGWTCPGKLAEAKKVFAEKVSAPAVELAPDQALRERCLQWAMELSGAAPFSNRTTRVITQSAMEIEHYFRTGT
jgi:hypothetical protein